MAPRKNYTENQQRQRDDNCDSLAHDPYHSSLDVGVSIVLSFRTRSFHDRFEIRSPELNWHSGDVSRETFFRKTRAPLT